MACSDDKCCGVTDAKPVADLRREAHEVIDTWDVWHDGETSPDCFICILADRAEAAERERDEALEMARRYGGNDGGHHKAWVIDQMVRALTGDRYAAWVAAAKAGNDGPETYDWEEGIAP